MKKLHQLIESEYESIKSIGMLYKLFPEATGNYVDDCRKSANAEDEEVEDSYNVDQELLDFADAFYAVQNINDDIISALSADSSDVESLTLVTDGNVCIVKFGDERIWFSLEDDRIFDEEENEYEDLEPFLRNAVHELLLARLGQYEAIADVLYDTL